MTKRSFLIRILLAFCALFTAIGFVLLPYAAAHAEAEQTEELPSVTTLLMQEGGSVRMKNADGTLKNVTGIRFTLWINQEYYNSLIVSEDETTIKPEVGVYVALASTTTEEALQSEDSAESAKKFKFVAEEDGLISYAAGVKTKEAIYAMNAVIAGLPTGEFSTKLMANGYVQKSGAEKVFAANPQSRSISQVASLALADKQADPDGVLKNYVDGSVTDVNFSFGKTYIQTDMFAAENPDVEATLPTDLTVIWTSSNPAVATVDENGTITRVGKGETTISATLGTKKLTATLIITESSVNDNVITDFSAATVASEQASGKGVSGLKGKTASTTTVSYLDEFVGKDEDVHYGVQKIELKEISLYGAGWFQLALNSETAQEVFDNGFDYITLRVYLQVSDALVAANNGGAGEELCLNFFDNDIHHRYFKTHTWVDFNITKEDYANDTATLANLVSGSNVLYTNNIKLEKLTDGTTTDYTSGGYNYRLCYRNNYGTTNNDFPTGIYTGYTRLNQVLDNFWLTMYVDEITYGKDTQAPEIVLEQESYTATENVAVDLDALYEVQKDNFDPYAPTVTTKLYKVDGDTETEYTLTDNKFTDKGTYRFEITATDRYGNVNVKNITVSTIGDIVSPTITLAKGSAATVQVNTQIDIIAYATIADNLSEYNAIQKTFTYYYLDGNGEKTQYDFLNNSSMFTQCGTYLCRITATDEESNSTSAEIYFNVVNVTTLVEGYDSASAIKETVKNNKIYPNVNHGGTMEWLEEYDGHYGVAKLNSAAFATDMTNVFTTTKDYAARIRIDMHPYMYAFMQAVYAEKGADQTKPVLVTSGISAATSSIPVNQWIDVTFTNTMPRVSNILKCNHPSNTEDCIRMTYTVGGATKNLYSNSLASILAKIGVVNDGSVTLADLYTLDFYVDYVAKNTDPVYVTFDADGGECTTAYQQALVDGYVTKPATPIKEAAEFIGWYNGDEEWDFVNDTVSEAMTLTAKWQKIDVNAPTITLTKGARVTLAKDPAFDVTQYVSVEDDLSEIDKIQVNYTYYKVDQYGKKQTYDFTGNNGIFTAAGTYICEISATDELSKNSQAQLTIQVTNFNTVTSSFDTKSSVNTTTMTSNQIYPNNSKGSVEWIEEYDGHYGVQKIVATSYDANGAGYLKVKAATKARMKIVLHPYAEAYLKYLLDTNNNTKAYDMDVTFALQGAAESLSWNTPINQWYDVSLGTFVYAQFAKLNGANLNWFIPRPALNNSYTGATGVSLAGVLSAIGVEDDTVTLQDLVTVTYYIDYIGTITDTTFKVYFESGADSVQTSDYRVVSGGHIPVPQTPVKEAYKFLGWYNGDTLWNFDANTVTESITLTAKWEALGEEDKLLVTFDPDNGNDVSYVSYYADSLIEKPAVPEKLGYTFLGWYDGDTLWDFENDYLTAHTTLTAKWEKDAEVAFYAVSFDSNGGSAVESQSVASGGKVTQPDDPIRYNYIFDGWYNGDTAWDFANDVVEGSLTLTAKWKEQTYQAVFDSNGGSDVQSQTIAVGGKITKPADPTLTDFVFVRWLLNGAEYDFDTEVYMDTVLVAEWKPAVCEVEFILNNQIVGRTLTGSGGVQEINYGGLIDENAVLDGVQAVYTRDDGEVFNFVFSGWYYTVGSVKYKFEATTPVTDHMVLTARWMAPTELVDPTSEASKKVQARAEGSNLRIMSYNVLGCEYASEETGFRSDIYKGDLTRANKVVQTIKNYMPDVVGLQESCQHYYDSVFNTEAFLPYKTVNGDKYVITPKLASAAGANLANNTKAANWNTIAYNSEKIECLVWGMWAYETSSNNAKCRNVTWALLKVKETGACFIATSTHWDLESDSNTSQPTIGRVKQAKELVAFNAAMEELYGVPVFNTGDFNIKCNNWSVNEQDQPCWIEFMKGGYANAKHEAEKRGFYTQTGFLGDGLNNGSSYSPNNFYLGKFMRTETYLDDDGNEYYECGGADQIFFSPTIKNGSTVTCKYYSVVVDTLAVCTTDHAPFIADFDMPTVALTEYETSVPQYMDEILTIADIS